MSQAVSLSQPDRLVARVTALLDRLFPPPRAFSIRLWNGAELAAASAPAFCLAIHHAGALRRMFTPPVELSLGEAFIYGDFDIEGDIFAAFSLLKPIYARASSAGEAVALVRDLLALPAAGADRLTGQGPARLSGALHTRERDRAAIQYHYDVGNEFYALWLDRRMQYSCAYFVTGAEDIDAAQEQKLEHICRKLRLQPGERLLDIGCGWGGLALYAAEQHGVTALGVTLSERQTEYAGRRIERAGLGDRVQVRLEDYRDVRDESFDKVVSVGMFESCHISVNQNLLVKPVHGKSHLPLTRADLYT